jgi:hypothetical protein
MKKLILAAIVAATLPALATAEMKMQNGNPNPGTEPALGHHMQNSNPSAETAVEPASAPEHVMRNSNPSPNPVPEHTMNNTNPKKFVSSNAASLEGASSEAEDAHRKKY